MARGEAIADLGDPERAHDYAEMQELDIHKTRAHHCLRRWHGRPLARSGSAHSHAPRLDQYRGSPALCW